ncbi:MAG: phage major capsid protein [Gemmataceae bacterium]|nr:phage major capsid protein [Gemmataceae bacterium]
MFVQLTKDYFGQKAGARVDVDEPIGRSLIDQGIAESISGDPLAPAVARSVEALTAGLTRSLGEALDSTLREFAIARTKSQRHAVPAIFGDGQRGDPRHTFGGFLLAVRHHDNKALEELGSRFADWDVGQKAAMSTTSGTTGGYTVPTQFLPTLMEAAAEQSVVRPRATIVPMSSRSVQVPYLDVTNAPTAGDSAFFGGLVARWSEEAAALNETEPTFRQLELVTHELSGYALLSNALLADNAVGLEALLVRLFGGAIAWFEDYAFLRGDGVGKPLGVANAPAAISVSRANANQFGLADAGQMLGKLLPGWSPRSTAWVIHPSVIPQMVQMVSAAAGVGWLDNLRDKLPMQLLGLPVAISEKLPALGTAKDVLLCDFRHYVVGDRHEVEIAFSEHYKFTNNQGTWRFVCRVDGQPWLRSAVTLSDASSTVSPYVYLT